MRSRILALNKALIIGTSLRVVIMCGLQVERDMISAFGKELSGQHEITLRGLTHYVWIFSKGKKIAKVVIASPEPAVLSCLRDATLSRVVTDVFGFTKALTNVLNLNNAFLENDKFYTALYRQRALEKVGEVAPMTWQTINTLSRDWLYRHGFVDDDDIRKIEEIAGSMSLGLVQLLGILAIQKKNLTGPGARGYRGKYDPVRYRQLIELWNVVHEQHLARIRTFRQIQKNFSYNNGEAVEYSQSTTWAHLDKFQAPKHVFIKSPQSNIAGHCSMSDQAGQDDLILRHPAITFLSNAADNYGFDQNALGPEDASGSCTRPKPEVFESAVEKSDARPNSLQELHAFLTYGSRARPLRITEDKRVAWISIISDTVKIPTGHTPS
ncbi:hypothetical protein GQ53DRAFT_831945 [Thozetella sp. PMI_491]|nr:hypothetical protein GQ53DRAFT_831945 [Thozetella sp. PMI_491]